MSKAMSPENPGKRFNNAYPAYVQSREDMPEPVAPGTDPSAWALAALGSVLQSKPERLDWSEVDRLADVERKNRIKVLNDISKKSLVAREDLHSQIDRLLDALGTTTDPESVDISHTYTTQNHEVI